uniref:Uncharacterized protein n=1 Tax=Plectus sambesii TaxID=2011161 RepID=A0A914W6N0_9BILA
MCGSRHITTARKTPPAPRPGRDTTQSLAPTPLNNHRRLALDNRQSMTAQRSHSTVDGQQRPFEAIARALSDDDDGDGGDGDAVAGNRRVDRP